MTQNEMDSLLNEARNYLDITWVDEELDRKLTGIIRRGMDYIGKWGGPGLNFTAEGQPKALLLDYCRYARSNALDEFRVNYGQDLRELQWERAQRLAAGWEGEG